MLCEIKKRISFIGACYFLGVIIASSAIPVGYISDFVGRKWIYVATLLSELMGCYTLIIANKLEVIYLGMFLLGFGHPGRAIVGF